LGTIDVSPYAAASVRHVRQSLGLRLVKDSGQLQDRRGYNGHFRSYFLHLASISTAEGVPEAPKARPAANCRSKTKLFFLTQGSCTLIKFQYRRVWPG
jgi:hypothetical protein